MIWLKRKYEIDLAFGEGRRTTDAMYGTIDHLMVQPEKSDTIWSMRIIDSGDDVIYEVIDHEGRLDYREGIPTGADKQEQLIVEIYDTTSNDLMTVIFKVRECA